MMFQTSEVSEDFRSLGKDLFFLLALDERL